MAIRELPKYESKKDNYIYVENVSNWAQKLLKVDNLPDKLGTDTETYYNPFMHAPYAISKWIKGGRNNCPFGVSLYANGVGVWIDHDLYSIKPVLENPSIEKILHNSKYDINMLKNIDITLAGRIWDTMIMIHLIDEEFMCKYIAEDGTIGFKKSKKLKDLAYHFLNGDAHELEDMVKQCRSIIAANTGRNVEQVSYKEVNDANPILMKDYAIADTDFCYKLFHKFMPMLAEQALFGAYDVDINATWAVVGIEREGYLMNRERMREDERILEGIISNRSGRIYTLCGRCGTDGFNINSDAELVTEFAKLGLPWRWFTDKGELQTDKKVMKEIQKAGEPRTTELAGLVLEFRKAEKILSTYITGVYPYIQEDGKVHPDFWISPDDYDRGGTKTGRLSSSNPNLQNIWKKPVSLEEGDDKYDED